MHSLVSDLVVASLAYVGTMFDNYFAFSAQLVVTARERYRRVAWAQALGVATLVIIALGVGTALAAVPLRLIGLLAIAPWALAWHAWQHRGDATRQVFRRGATTTFLATLALGGDNLAVWIPLLRAKGVAGALIMVAAFAVLEVAFILSSQYLASRPRVVDWGTRRASSLVPVIYGALGVLVLLECHTL